jgi:DNA-binding protein Fis
MTIVAEIHDSMRLDFAMRQHVEHVLYLCVGNQSEAARRLGISRWTLRRMMLRWAKEDSRGVQAR